MTIDQGPEMSRYQGLVPLEGGDLEQAAHEYFARSDQIPTRVRLAVAEEFRAGANGARRRWRFLKLWTRAPRTMMESASPVLESRPDSPLAVGRGAIPCNPAVSTPEAPPPLAAATAPYSCPFGCGL